MDEESCKPLDAEYKPVKQDSQAEGHFEGCLGVARPLLVSQNGKVGLKIHGTTFFLGTSQMWGPGL